MSVNISQEERSDSSTLTRDRLYITPTTMDTRCPGTPRVSITCYPGSPRVSVGYHCNTSIPSLDALSLNKNRRRSTIHSYNLVNYYALPTDSSNNRSIRQMTEKKAYKNIIVLGLSFMFVHTAFVSILSLQSIMNTEGGIGVVSISCIYATTVISCLLAPLIINTITTKWTMICAFVLFIGYFAGNFYPSKFLLIPLGLLLGLLGGPLMAAQMTYVTTIALTYANHALILDQESVVNKFMGIFCAFYRSSYIWGNLITTLVLSNNQTLHVEVDNDIYQTISTTNFTALYLSPQNTSVFRHCGSLTCEVNQILKKDEVYDIGYNPYTHETEIPENIKFMLLGIYLGCGVMAVALLIALLDGNVGSKRINKDLRITMKELFLSTIKMLKDSRCQLLIPLVLFVGLEQGFIFGDFTKAFVNCTLGVYSLGPILMCFGAVSALSSIVISCIAKHIKRFAFITAGATFNAGLLIVLWLWNPHPGDVPNFFVVSACLGLCDAIWQTQTYTLFGVLFVDKQEAAFACYRMLYATGCAVSFGYSFFLCVQTKVYILAGMLFIALCMYSIIEMKVQWQSQHIKDIVAF